MYAPTSHLIVVGATFHARRLRGDRRGRVDRHDAVVAVDLDVVVGGAAHHDDADVDELAFAVSRRVDVDRRHRRRRRAGDAVDRVEPVAAVHDAPAADDRVGERAAVDLLDPEQRLVAAVAVGATTALAGAVEANAHAIDLVDRAVGQELRLAGRQRGREADDVVAIAADERVVAGVAAQEVVAGAAVERVGAVATDQDVVAVLAVKVVVEDVAEQHVVAGAAPDAVAVGAAMNDVVAFTAEDLVLAGAAVDVVVAAEAADDVVAAVAEDDVGLVGAEDDVGPVGADEVMAARVLDVRARPQLRVLAGVATGGHVVERQLHRVDLAHVTRREDQQERQQLRAHACAPSATGGPTLSPRCETTATWKSSGGRPHDCKLS